MYLAIGERISYTPSIEHIVDWMMLKTLAFCSKTLLLFRLRHDHVIKKPGSPRVRMLVFWRSLGTWLNVLYVYQFELCTDLKEGYYTIMYNNASTTVDITTLFSSIVVISWDLKFHNQLYWPARVLQSDQLCHMLEKNGRQRRFHVSCTVAALTWAVW